MPLKYETCERHDVEVALITQAEAEELKVSYGCPGCRGDLENRQDPQGMSREERVAELQEIMGEGNFAPFDLIWKRVDQLVGRSTYTHELAYPMYLEHEIMTGFVPSFEGIIAKLPEDMEVIVVLADDPQGS